MQIWRMSFTTPQDGTILSWHGTKGDAEAALAVMQRDHECAGVQLVEQVDVPTVKHDLIRWLNANLNTDNG